MADPQTQTLNNPWAAPADPQATAAPAVAAAPPSRAALANPWTSETPRLKNPWGSPAGQPANSQPTEPADAGHWWSRSLIQDVAGSDVTEAGRQKIVSSLKGFLPASMQGSYLTGLADEVSKAGPQFVNFLTSPMGVGLTVAHMFPASAPYAAVGDLLLGGQQALRAIPDVTDAAMNIRDPHKMGRALVDVLGAYAGLKGGARVGEAMRSIPADTGAGMSLGGQVKAMTGAYSDAFGRTAPPPAAPGTRGADLRAQLETAPDPEGRADIISQAEQPQNLRERTEQALYRTPSVRGIVNVLAPRVQKPAVLDLGQNLVDEYIGNVAEQQNKVRRVTDWIQRNVPESDRNIRRMGYAMEGDLPETDLSPQAREGLEKIRQLNRDRDQMLIDSGQSESMLKDPDTYIRHYWDFDVPGGDAAKRAIATRMMRDPSLQARKIGSLKLGIEDNGLMPKYEDVTDVVGRRHMEATRAVENQRFANTLRDYGLIVDPTKANTRALSTWEPAVDAPAIKRAVYSGTDSAGNTIMRDKPPLVHPDIQMAVNAIFNEPFKGVGWNAINQLRAFSKQIGVGYSLFHNNIISEVSQAHAAGAGGLEMIPRVAKAIAWPLDPDFQWP